MTFLLRLALALALLPLRFALALLLAPLRALGLAVTRPLRLRAARRNVARAYRAFGMMADGVVRVRDRRFPHPVVI